MELIAAIFKDGVPVRIVGDQQDAAHAQDKAMGEFCDHCGEMPCKCDEQLREMMGYDDED